MQTLQAGLQVTGEIRLRE